MPHGNKSPPLARKSPPANADGLTVQTNSVSAAPAFFADFQHAARRSRQKQEHEKSTEKKSTKNLTFPLAGIKEQPSA